MKKFAYSLILALAAFALVAGSGREDDLKRIAEHVSKKDYKPWTWVFYGDSITHGARHTYGWRSFQEIFHERIRGEYLLKDDLVINSGSSGYTTFELLRDWYYQRMVGNFKPQVVLLLIGCNDIVHPNCNGPDGFRSRLDTLVARLKGDGAIVVLQTYNTIEEIVTPTASHHHGYIKRFKEFPAFNQVIRDVAEKYDTILIDHEAHWKENASDKETLMFWLGESIHPGARGHLEMAKLILKGTGLYDYRSSALSVEAGGKGPALKSASPIAKDTVIMNQNFDKDIPAGQVPKTGNFNGGIWGVVGDKGSFTVLSGEGFDGSNCLKVLRDGKAGLMLLRSDKQFSSSQNYEFEWKLKLKPGCGVAITFLGNESKMVGGSLFWADKPTKAYNAKAAWELCGITENFPANEWITCRAEFDQAAKGYRISFTTPDGRTLGGSRVHPLLSENVANEIRFLNVLPQQCYSLIDDVSFRAK